MLIISSAPCVGLLSFILLDKQSCQGIKPMCKKKAFFLNKLLTAVDKVELLVLASPLNEIPHVHCLVCHLIAIVVVLWLSKFSIQLASL